MRLSESLNSTATLSQRLDHEMKKQRLKFRFYRDYFNSSFGQAKLKENRFSTTKLKNILESIRLEFRMCLYPADYNEPVEGAGHKFKHILTIQHHLDQLEYLKESINPRESHTRVIRETVT